jgi:hypothetical protein
MEVVAQNNDLAIIDKSLEIFKNGSALLKSNQDRAGKALAVGSNILQVINGAGGEINNEELDARCMKYLANCNAATKEMKESRMQVTQMMDTIKKMYTEEENKLDSTKPDTVPFKIQQFRNGYARKVAQEEERKRKEAEVKAAKAKEQVEITAYINNQIAQCLLDYLSKRKIAITNKFNEIQLPEFSEKSTALQAMATSFPVDKVKEIVKYLSPTYSKHTDAEFLVIQGTVHDEYDFPSFYKEYQRQIGELKQSLVDRLPSKLQELQEQKRIADEAEAARLQELKKHEEAERARQEQIQQASAAEKKRLEEKAHLERKAEADRLQQMQKEAEEKRLVADAEQKRREQEDAERLQKEAEESRKKAEQESQLRMAAGTAQVLFDQVSETAIVTPAPEARTGFEINVIHPAGWVEIFQLWFQREGCKMKPDEIEKKTFKQLKSYVEGIAKSDDIKIESKYLSYGSKVKAINRKSTGGN